MKFSELVRPEVQYYLENANFTKDEREIFVLLTKGKTIIEISEITMLSEATVSRRISDIKKKIIKLNSCKGN